MKKPLKNKLPRKRKKAFKKATQPSTYMMTRIFNEVLFEERGTPCRFPKVKRDSSNPKGYSIIGYW